MILILKVTRASFTYFLRGKNRQKTNLESVECLAIKTTFPEPWSALQSAIP